MSVRDALRFDHSYAMVREAEFRELIPLTSLLRGARHSMVKTEAGSWEGIHLFSQSGSYFEILNETDGFGLALSVPPAQSFHWRAALCRHPARA